jgi:hypothetical protein
MESNQDNIPIFITIIGNTSVGKSYYFFSLGLALSKYPSLREYWEVTGISDGYKKQIKIWKREHIEDEKEHKIGATDLGKNIQLSFTIKNKRTLRKYQIFMADMAGEQIAKYLNNESIDDHITIANDIKMRIRLSSGILLMLDSNKLILNAEKKEKEIDACVELLTTGIFSTLNICLMKADYFEFVKQKLKEDSKINLLNTSQKQEEQQYAENVFSDEKLVKIPNYMKNHNISARYHWVSSIALCRDNQVKKLESVLSARVMMKTLQREKTE